MSDRKRTIVNYDGKDPRVLMDLIEDAKDTGATIIINAPQFNLSNTNTPTFANSPTFTNSPQTTVSSHVSAVSQANPHLINAQAQAQEQKPGFFARLFGRGKQQPQITPASSNVESSDEFELSEALNEWYRPFP